MSDNPDLDHLYDEANRAMAEQHADCQRVEEQAVLALRKSLTQPLTEDEAHLVCWRAGIDWKQVKPRRSPERTPK